MALIRTSALVLLSLIIQRASANDDDDINSLRKRKNEVYKKFRQKYDEICAGKQCCVAPGSRFRNLSGRRSRGNRADLDEQQTAFVNYLSSEPCSGDGVLSYDFAWFSNYLNEKISRQVRLQFAVYDEKMADFETPDEYLNHVISDKPLYDHYMKLIETMENESPEILIPSGMMDDRLKVVFSEYCDVQQLLMTKVYDLWHDTNKLEQWPRFDASTGEITEEKRAQKKAKNSPKLILFNEPALLSSEHKARGNYLIYEKEHTLSTGYVLNLCEHHIIPKARVRDFYKIFVKFRKSSNFATDKQISRWNVQSIALRLRYLYFIKNKFVKFVVHSGESQEAHALKEDWWSRLMFREFVYFPGNSFLGPPSKLRKNDAKEKIFDKEARGIISDFRYTELERLNKEMEQLEKDETLQTPYTILKIAQEFHAVAAVFPIAKFEEADWKYDTTKPDKGRSWEREYEAPSAKRSKRNSACSSSRIGAANETHDLRCCLEYAITEHLLTADSIDWSTELLDDMSSYLVRTNFNLNLETSLAFFVDLIMRDMSQNRGNVRGGSGDDSLEKIINRLMGITSDRLETTASTEEPWSSIERQQDRAMFCHGALSLVGPVGLVLWNYFDPCPKFRYGLFGPQERPQSFGTVLSHSIGKRDTADDTSLCRVCETCLADQSQQQRKSYHHHRTERALNSTKAREVFCALVDIFPLHRDNAWLPCFESNCFNSL